MNYSVKTVLTFLASTASTAVYCHATSLRGSEELNLLNNTSSQELSSFIEAGLELPRNKQGGPNRRLSLSTEKTCRDVSTSFHADKSNGQIGINVKLLSDLSSVLAPRWNNACSKIQPGECAWFHTSLDKSSSWFLPSDMSPVDYAQDVGAVATQSSTCYGGEPSRAIDGNWDGQWGAGSVTHTCNDNNPWLMVDLGANKQRVIKWVNIYNRMDCCWDRIAGANVHILDEDGNIVASQLNIAGSDKIRSFELDFGGVTGRYVRIEKSSGFISVAEIRVLGLPHAESEAYYAADWAGTDGSFDWPELHGFAYHVCRTSGSSSDCKADGDLQLSELCASRSSIGDDVDLAVEDLEHRYSYQGGSGRWDMLYQGKIINEFRIASVNAHLFKGSGVGDVYMDEERQESIFGYIGNFGKYDFLGFTEVWADSRREDWKSRLDSRGYSGSVVPIPDVDRYLFAGSPGMVFADKGDTHQTCFMHYQGMTGDDSFAYKGVVYGASTLRGTTFGWLLTHAQASYTGSKDDDDAARIRQIKETLIPAAKTVVKWMKDNKDPLQGPTILLGDLNIIGDTTTEYNNFLATMKEIGFVDCWLETKKSGTSQDGFTYDHTRNNLVKHFDPDQSTQQRLDYIFLHPGESGATCQDFRVGDDWKTGYGTNVSDHDPVEVVIRGIREGAKVKSSFSIMPCKEACRRDDKCATNDCFNGDECQCNDATNIGCASGEKCYDLSIYETNVCLPAGTRFGNGSKCDTSSMCSSNCCSWTAAGANTCEEYKWWRTCV